MGFNSQSFDPNEGITWGSYAEFELVKKLILEKRFHLTESYDRYIEVTRIRGIRHYPPGWNALTKALNSLYLEIRPKITRKNYQTSYKETIRLMDDSIKGNKQLTEQEAIQCTMDLLNFIEDLGITDILFEKQDKGQAVLNF